MAVAEGNGGALGCGGGCFLEATNGFTSLLGTHTKVSGPQELSIHMVSHTSASLELGYVDQIRVGCHPF